MRKSQRVRKSESQRSKESKRQRGRETERQKGRKAKEWDIEELTAELQRNKGVKRSQVPGDRLPHNSVPGTKVIQ